MFNRKKTLSTSASSTLSTVTNPNQNANVVRLNSTKTTLSEVDI